MNPENAVSRLSPGMAECHARLMAVAKHGTPEAFSATLAGVLQRAELSISNAYDAGAKSIQVTNQQGAPEALRTITRYEVVDCIDSKHVPAVIPNKDGPWVRYEDHLAALVEAQQPAPSAAVAEIEGGPPGSGGWEKHAIEMERQRDYYRQRCHTMEEHQNGGVWYWQGDDGDSLESMGNSMLVVIRADQLRSLMQPSPTPQADQLQPIVALQESAGMYADDFAPQADSQPAPDERDDFEKVFPLPSGCIRCGTGYASTGYSNWDAHKHVERWQGWKARASHGQAPVGATEPVAYLHDDGYWTPAKTDEGRKLNDRLQFAGSPKIGVHLAAPTAQPAPAATFQQRVQPWLLECFGAEIAADRVECNHRFLEEALELVQSLGCTASEAHQLVDYVFGRPVGDPPQEVGGVMVILAALCLASGLDMHDAGEVELTRISAPELVAKIRAKQAAKPKHSPLPQSPTPQADSQPAPALDRDRIREIFMAHGFTVKEGQTDLKQYVYDAADALLRAARAPADSVTAPAASAVAGPTSGLHPEKCPITGRPFFMTLDHSELGRVPTYGGPYDSYTIPAPEGEPTDPWHERELRSERYDHDAGWWVEGGEPIPLRIVHEDVLFKLQEGAEAAAAPTPPAQAADSVLEDAARLEFEMQHGSAIDAAMNKGGA